MTYPTEYAVQLFHIHPLFLTYHNFCWGWRSL